MSEPATFTAPTSKGPRRVRGVLVATNLATHRPVDGLRMVDLSQVSSGKLVGRFATTEDAASFASAALRFVPELGTGEAFSQNHHNFLAQLRDTYNGRRN